MILRFEPWGAWAKLESVPALVALDREGVRALGLDGGDAWRKPRPSGPVEVHLAVTSKCGVGCQGCYLDARPDGRERPRATIEQELDAMRDAGVFTVAFGGGEPTTREDLGELAREASLRGLTPVLTTSGIGLTEARIEGLRHFAQVNVSYDGAGAAYALVRGVAAAAAAERAIERLAARGIRVGVNVVLTRETFAQLGETLRRARDLGACEAQLLRYKPAGRAAAPEYFARRLTPEQARDLGTVLRRLACDFGAVHPSAGGHSRLQEEFRIRIDCALVPFLSADEELGGDPDVWTRFGVFGCEAAGALLAIGETGRVAPCSFASASQLPGAELSSHGQNDELNRWRAWNEAPPAPCSTCALRPVCKGGCKVVASFVDGVHGPDPECPRVLAWKAATTR
jgi:radical SAM protein with 4Fe4S-binding SPASM domain